jgi:hypothetical protein|tara:strand:- start:16150 stop:16716 length:567 start_codon:yes stop_codon:yes gene_type:complete
MGFLFENFPTVSYDIKKNGKTEILTDLTVRFKLQKALDNRTVITYDYNVVDGERPDIIADKYYSDSSLDWIVILTNKMIDPMWEWPMDQQSFGKYIRKKYGSAVTAQSTVHHYEKIITQASTRFDGTFIPELAVWIDLETYNTLSPDVKRTVDAYEYENELNEQKAIIKILDERYVTSLLNEIETVFE